MTKRRVAFLAAVALSIAAAGSPASAQVTPPPRPALSEPDAQKAALLDAQKAAFLAMPEADRKAAQDGLGWGGFYNGGLDGAFGKRTLDSILAYQASVGAPATGVLSSAQMAALKLSGQKARAEVGFRLIDDPRTGIRIGAPMKLLEKRTETSASTQLTSRDGAISLELLAPEGALAALYGRLTADMPDRKISYKAIKPDVFFVVAGEQAGRKFYARYATAPPGAAGAGAVRGFVFAYPAARSAELDRVALAIANSFEPFAAPSARAPASVAGPLAIGLTLAPTPAAAPGEPVLTATALIVAPGQAATVLGEADCNSPTIEGKPVKFIRAAADGLALLGGDFGGAASSIRLASAAEDVVVLSLAPGRGSGKAVLEASDATAAPTSGPRKAVVAALSKSARGAPAFDRQGALVAFVAPLGAEPKRRDGVVLAEPHALVDASAAGGFAKWASVGADAAEAPLGAADIARRMRGAIAGVYCGP